MSVSGEVDGTAYVESATACGLHHVPRDRRDPDSARRATTRGVGELVAAARDAGVSRIVVGLGGSATTGGTASAAGSAALRRIKHIRGWNAPCSLRPPMTTGTLRDPSRA